MHKYYIVQIFKYVMHTFSFVYYCYKTMWLKYCYINIY